MEQNAGDSSRFQTCLYPQEETAYQALAVKIANRGLLDGHNFLGLPLERVELGVHYEKQIGVAFLFIWETNLFLSILTFQQLYRQKYV